MALPSEWEDDQTMDVLFSPFRENRDVNPHSWDKKMTFWTNVICNYCKDKAIVCIDVNHLPELFERKGRRPACLDKVLEELVKTRKLQTVEDFMEDNSSWVRWGLKWAIRKPAAWTLNTLVKRPLGWTYSKLLGSQASSSSNYRQLIVSQVLEDTSFELLKHHYSHMSHQTTDIVIGYDELYNQTKHLYKDQQSFYYCILKLVKDKKCVIFEAGNQQKVLRFAKNEKRSVTPPNDCDIKLYKLKSTENTLQEQINKLTMECITLRDNAKFSLREGNKTAAISYLRKKKRTELLRSQKEKALDNLEQLRSAIEEADSQKQVLDAYSSGSQAFKEITKQYGLDPDKVDDVMLELEETFEMHEDINRSLIQPSTSTTEPSISELEHELSIILSEGGADDSGGFFGGDLPEVPSDEPGSNTLVDISSTVLDPHQELVDSLCQMKLQATILDDDLADLELPDVPTFNPNASRSKVSQPTADHH